MRGGARVFSGILVVGLCLFAGTTHAAFVTLTQTSEVGSVFSFDIIYDSEGAAELDTLDLVITTDVLVPSITGTQVPGLFLIGEATDFPAGHPQCGGAGSLACVQYGGTNLNTVVLPTPGPITLGTVTVDIGANDVVNLMQGIPPVNFLAPGFIRLPNNTVDPLATVPEPSALALLGVAFASVALMRR